MSTAARSRRSSKPGEYVPGSISNRAPDSSTKRHACPYFVSRTAPASHTPDSGLEGVPEIPDEGLVRAEAA
jgi:hypothetical protein